MAEVWTDPQAVAANEAGRVTPEQHALVVGRHPGAPWLSIGLAGATVLIPAVLVVTEQPPGAVVYVTLLLGSWALPTAFAQRAARRDRADLVTSLAAPAIDSGIGEVLPFLSSPGERRARVGDRWLNTPLRSPPLPPPGWYRLFWLRDRDVLLSAEPVALHGTLPAGAAAAHVAAEVQRQRQTLIEAGGGTEADVAVNRDGRLTEAQRAQLARSLRRAPAAVAALLLVAAGLSLAGWLFLRLPREDEPFFWAPTAACAAFGAMFVWLGLTSTGKALRTRTILRASAPVATYTGPVSVRSSDSSWSLRFGSVSYPVSSEAGDVLLRPRHYTVHHLPAIEALLSIELAEPTEPAEPAEGEVRAPEG